MFFAEKFSQSQCSICPVGSHCHNTRSRRCEGSTRICSFQRQFEIRNFQRQVQICNFQRWVQICNFQRWFKIRNFQKWPFKDKQGEHTYFFSAASSFFFFSLPLSSLDTFSLFFLELMALAVVALVPALILALLLILWRCQWLQWALALELLCWCCHSCFLLGGVLALLLVLFTCAVRRAGYWCGGSCFGSLGLFV